MRAARSAVGLGALLAATALIAACSSNGSTQGTSARRPVSSPATAASSPSVTGSTVELPSCVTAAEARAHLHTVTLSGGQARPALEYGTGSVGVVLIHQSDGDLCQWKSYAATLGRRGYRAFAMTYQDDYVSECLAAVKAVRAAGATSVVLLGASMGGTIAISTAVKMSPPPRAVLSLSGPQDYAELHALPAARQLRAPVFFAASTHDLPFGPDAKTLYRAATHAAERRLVLDTVDYLHGLELLGVGKVRSAMEAFLARYAPAGR